MAAQVVVVIPYWGANKQNGEYLRETVSSALTVCDRVVVVDDASPYPPRDSRVQVVTRTHNGGPAAALNSGIGVLEGDSLVCRLDCRDSFMAEPKRRQIAATKRASFAWTFDPISRRIRMPAPKWRTRIFTDNQFSGSGVVFAVETWNLVGGFDETLRWGSDWDFAIKVQRAIGWEEFAEVAGEHGEHPGGHTDVSANKQLAELRDADLRRVRERAQSR